MFVNRSVGAHPRLGAMLPERGPARGNRSAQCELACSVAAVCVSLSYLLESSHDLFNSVVTLRCLTVLINVAVSCLPEILVSSCLVVGSSVGAILSSETEKVVVGIEFFCDGASSWATKA